jgi:membrane carboxypeptidase/penicillin-binding protein
VGLSENLADWWTIGYTPQVVLGVWVGNADNRPMRGSFGTGGPVPIWHEILDVALKGQTVVPFTRPAGLVQARIDLATGLLAVPGRPWTTDWFAQGTVPTDGAPIVFADGSGD